MAQIRQETKKDLMTLLLCQKLAGDKGVVNMRKKISAKILLGGFRPPLPILPEALSLFRHC